MNSKAPNVLEYTQRQDLQKVLEVAIKTNKLLEKISQNIKPGMKESEAKAMALSLYKDHGITRSWHQPYIRFGTNTICTFKDKALTDNILQEEDIAFIDIGPIFDDIEGDAGHTLVFGDNPLFLELQKQSKEIFSLAHQFWKTNNPTGIELHKFIIETTEKKGFIFNLEPAGHLIGSFSHEASSEGGIDSYPKTIKPGHWILEIQIRHPEKPYGAFYESILDEVHYA